MLQPWFAEQTTQKPTANHITDSTSSLPSGGDFLLHLPHGRIGHVKNHQDRQHDGHDIDLSATYWMLLSICHIFPAVKDRYVSRHHSKRCFSILLKEISIDFRFLFYYYGHHLLLQKFIPGILKAQNRSYALCHLRWWTAAVTLNVRIVILRYARLVCYHSLW